MVDTNTLKATFQRELDHLIEARDELRVQLQLAKKEVAQEWSHLESLGDKLQDEASEQKAR